MDTLPVEIQDIIWKYYWQDIFTRRVIDSVTSHTQLCKELDTFLNNYCFRQRFFDTVYHYYLVKLNDKIKSFVSTPNTFLLCNINNSPLNHCFNIETNPTQTFITNHVNESLWYICSYCIARSKHQRYKIYQQFCRMSLCCI
jgi:hypothetical protein|uniref:Uncharacterized protein n=1 Tax=viral metagenome TaxID=1070528 RepID=A0A6C0J9M4_9ZZZZ